MKEGVLSKTQGVIAPTADQEDRYIEAVLERHKREGLGLAVKARWWAMSFVGVFLLFVAPWPQVLYYEFILLLLCANGWLIQRMGRVGRSRMEVFLIFLDLLLMTVGMVAPNPLGEHDWPAAMRYQYDNFQYFYLILAAGTLAYSWRTVIAIGTWTGVMWLIGVGLSVWLAEPVRGLSQAVADALPAFPELARQLDPNAFRLDLRIQEVFVFILVALTLGLTVRRFNALLRSNAALERERTNLSRYFSPNVVEELSQNDEPLKQIRSHDIAVLFVDIVGFTEFAAARKPEEVIGTLREFHGLMETAVFAHEGTLDKYLGDGLMATFGTPSPSDRDAQNALRCVRQMMRDVDDWNEARIAQGITPLRVGFGAHYGPAVLADIGANRLEFAVVGNTVNVASRLESMTRGLNARLVISDGMRAEVLREGGDECLEGLQKFTDQDIRGVSEKLTVWAYERPREHGFTST
ncbi:adenylate/guanylate cyclase domain-containing protein [Shimia sp. R10_1]|uniref:adenylate/guanylate cyclase domain-containing protein n=1 Tax=Shimia sp. R10_1 TaxID=2821095 RepID=UPI001ADD01A4|nr:adenylate/guanylate cyclase domain-containing protein [Shimia sp. R10_1]MBO9474079.1 adenylate/guanylate cyclase domain-containing protein [Shimia sp. R10_1]